ncbi:MAG: methyltransferase domain-containing protein [Calditrichaeota bacterium]|nr:methyltransferase domain-containing protein [Calditrichota bacterium]
MREVLVECKSCGYKKQFEFYKLYQVPVHSVLLMEKHSEAVNYPRGEISLGFCPACGFISNTKFDPGYHEYSSKYEETQGFSHTFNKFHKELALKLIEKHDLRNKKIIEIGCGKGEFITMLCELGPNTGYGFDPAYVSERNISTARERVEFIQDFYSEKYVNYHADFVCCKMTLEHIPDTLEFMKVVRRSIADRFNTIVFFQVPDMVRILKDAGFWDIYYEHCSYFTSGSLARLFRKAGFEVLDLYKAYDDQYLMIEAKPVNGSGRKILIQEESVEDIRQLIGQFEEKIETIFRSWQKFLSGKKKTVLWGGGSKGVAFLTTLKLNSEVQYAVDINPYKHGTYMAGTGQKIVSPDFLKKYQPDLVIVMNPIYMDEIKNDLQKLGINPHILPIDHF